MQTATTIKKLSEAQRKFILFVGVNFGKEIDYYINPELRVTDKDGNQLHRFVQVVSNIVKTGEYEDRFSNELNSIRRRYDKIYKASKFKHKSIIVLEGINEDGIPKKWIMQFNRKKTLDWESSFRQSAHGASGISKQPIAGYMFANIDDDYIDDTGGFINGCGFNTIRQATDAEAKEFEHKLREFFEEKKKGWTY